MHDEVGRLAKALEVGARLAIVGKPFAAALSTKSSPSSELAAFDSFTIDTKLDSSCGLKLKVGLSSSLLLPATCSLTLFLNFLFFLNCGFEVWPKPKRKKRKVSHHKQIFNRMTSFSVLTLASLSLIETVFVFILSQFCRWSKVNYVVVLFWLQVVPCVQQTKKMVNKW